MWRSLHDHIILGALYQQSYKDDSLVSLCTYNIDAISSCYYLQLKFHNDAKSGGVHEKAVSTQLKKKRHLPP